MTQNDTIVNVVERNRSWWGVAMVVIFIYLIFFEPWYYLLGAVVFGVISYQLMILGTVVWLEMSMAGQPISQVDRLEAVERLNELAANGVTEGEEVDYLKNMAGVTNATVVEFSDEVLGRYMDNPIYAWIEMGPEGKLERYVFDDIAQRDKGGNFMLNLDGSIYALLHGVNYKLVEPAKS
jgi:hypothetical protein